MNQKKILIFHIDSQKQKQIKNICDECDMKLITVLPKQYEETLGVLAEIIGMKSTGKKYNGPDFPAEMMIFSGIDSDQLDVFLQKYREKKIAPVALKAVITPTNVNWTPLQMQQELLKEHLEFEKMQRK